MIALENLRRLAVPLAVLGVAVALSAGCGGGDSASGGGSLGNGVVAKVAGEEITQAQLDEVIAQAQDRLEAQGQKIPAAGSADYQAFQQSALQYLVQRAEYAQKAQELGVSVTDKQVQERLDQVIKQFFAGDDKKYEDSLTKQGITNEQVRDELRATLISEGVFKKVGESATVTAAEIEAYYNSQIAQYTKQSSRQVRHILVSSKQLADQIYRRLQAGEDFAALAKKYSTDSSKDIGGKLTIERGQTVPAFDKVAFELKKNEISKPVKTRFGWHVIQALDDPTVAKTTPLAEVRDQIRATLKGQKQSEEVTKWLEALKKEYAGKVEYAKGFAPPATDTTTTSTS